MDESHLLTCSPGLASFHSARKNYLGRLLDLGRFSLSLQPIVQAVSVISSTLLVELIGTRTNMVLQFTATVRLLEVCFDRHRGDYLGRLHFNFLLQMIVSLLSTKPGHAMCQASMGAKLHRTNIKDTIGLTFRLAVVKGIGPRMSKVSDITTLQVPLYA